MSQALQLTTLITLKAASNISRGTALGANGAPANAGDPIAGIALFDAAAGEPVTVAASGSVVEAIAGAAITPGALLEVGTNGQLKPRTAGAVAALAVGSASTQGDRVLVLVK